MRMTLKSLCQGMLVILAAAVVGAADTTKMPPPGTLNYVEGQVLVQGQKETPKSVGSTYVESNQDLQTRNGNAEMLLTPGVYLRLGHNSDVKMISPGLADTQVKLTSGSAMLEVDELFNENDVSVVVGNATVQVEKKGLYSFDAAEPSVSVLDGKAVVREGDQQVQLKKGREVVLASSERLRPEKYSKSSYKDDPLYRWSKLRSEYATESNVETANALLLGGGWYGPGWYWDPFMWDFAFLPGDGMFWGPFGGAFFSPGWVSYAPYYGYYGGYRTYYRYNTARPAATVPPLARSVTPGAVRSGSAPAPRSGFRSFAMSGGGMRMGGFHSGGYGGGMRGGLGGGMHGSFGRR